MTRDLEIERVLDRWLREGPTEVPDRVIDAVVDRIERQAQRPAWLQGWRALRPNARAGVAVAAFAAVVIVVVGFGLRWPGFNSYGGLQVPVPTPSPTRAPTPSPTLSPIFTCEDGSKINLRAPASTDGCSGPLAPGPHSATHFGIQFTVPAGWENRRDAADRFAISPYGAAPVQGILVWRDPVISAQNAGCTSDPQPGLGHTVDALVSYLTSHQGLVVSRPTPITIGGLSGLSLDVHIAPTWTGFCGFNDQRTVMYLTTEDAHPYYWGTDSQEHQRMIFLDDGKGGVIVVGINSPSEYGFSQLLQDSTPIVNSFAFAASDQSPSPGPSTSP